MKKAGKIAVALGIIAVIGMNAVQIGLVCTMQDEMLSYQKKHLRQILSINRRLEDIEEGEIVLPAVGQEETERWDDTDKPDGIDTIETAPSTSTADTATAEKEPSQDVFAPEEATDDVSVHVTLPADTLPLPAPETNTAEGQTLPTEIPTQAPEADTVASLEPTTEAVTSPCDSEAASAPYELRVYRGIIGVFDENGRLCETCNVYVMTLPRKDREALSAGIWVSSYEEAEAVLDRYR